MSRAFKSSQFDKEFLREIFETYYDEFGAICSRLSKNKTEAEEMLCYAFFNSLSKLTKSAISPEGASEFRVEFTKNCIQFLKSSDTNYYVGSTVDSRKDSQLAETNSKQTNFIDFSKVPSQLFLEVLHQLAPAQRLIFNLVVLEEFHLEAAANLMDCSIAAAKMNLEKARKNFNEILYNLVNQKP